MPARRSLAAKKVRSAEVWLPESTPMRGGAAMLLAALCPADAPCTLGVCMAACSSSTTTALARDKGWAMARLCSPCCPAAGVGVAPHHPQDLTSQILTQQRSLLSPALPGVGAALQHRVGF